MQCTYVLFLTYKEAEYTVTVVQNYEEAEYTFTFSTPLHC